ncbi:hypothetical protein FB451DRAFT_1051838 [Mycena latifolia]|nr:hypothetical protein FB451DRAFT_1051838 [Mycena latifolia]
MPRIETRRRHTSTSWSVQNENVPLSKLEIGSIHASVQSAAQDLAQLERDLAHAQKTVRALSKSCQSLRVFIASERALLSQIRSLPRELLAEIFVHHSCIFPGHRDCIAAPLTVSQVCVLWRGIAHTTPALWVRFPLYYSAGYGSEIPELQMEPRLA